MDEDMRTLERKAAAGDDQAGAGLLLLRVRAGGLSRDRLEVAAHCGHAQARLALEVDGEEAGLVDGRATMDWVRDLARWGKRPAVLASLVAAEAVLPAWEGEQGYRFDPGERALVQTKSRGLRIHLEVARNRSAFVVRPRLALGAVSAWVRDPTDGNQSTCGSHRGHGMPEWAADLARAASLGQRRRAGRRHQSYNWGSLCANSFACSVADARRLGVDLPDPPPGASSGENECFGRMRRHVSGVLVAWSLHGVLRIQ